MGASEEGVGAGVSKWQVVLSVQARREMKKLPHHLRIPVAKRIDWLAENADFIQHEKMTGAEEYSLHVGQFRILYTLDFQARTITIVDIGKHNEVYQRLRKRVGRRRK
ncbi:mRNA interferase RelE/StbE [Candidatus Fervidibacteria bacterium JGI MDM2 JNZ-1-D12]